MKGGTDPFIRLKKEIYIYIKETYIYITYISIYPHIYQIHICMCTCVLIYY